MIKAATLVAILSTIILAEATPALRDIPGSQFTAASLLCCNAVHPASDPAVSTLLALLGRSDVAPSTKCGLQCTPMTVLGVGGSSWYV